MSVKNVLRAIELVKGISKVRRWAVRAVYSSRVCRWLFQFCSTANAKVRGMAQSVLRRGRRDREAIDPADRISRFRIYQRDYAHIHGWFLDEAQALWDCLLSFQQQQSLRGNMLEVGVWKGKSATCSALHARDDEYCVFVDRMMLPEFKSAIKSIRPDNNHFLRRNAANLSRLPEVMDLGATYRWIHIDAEHSGEAVRRELTVAKQLLVRQGVICVDDFPSCSYPQVTFAVTQFLAENPDLTMFICGHNKGYICHQDCAQDYLAFIKNDLHGEMKLRGADVTIWKTGRESDWNCFGVTDRVDDFDYRGPDWDPGKIEI